MDIEKDISVSAITDVHHGIHNETNAFSQLERD